MLEALLDRAPDPEALVLIAYALEASCHRSREDLRPSLPAQPKDWAKRLFESFGARAGVALVRIAERRMNGEMLGTWLLALLPLLDRLPADAPARLRRRALEQLHSPLSDDWGEAIEVLTQLGVPSEAAPRLRELVDASNAWPEHQNRPPRGASDALARVSDDRTDEWLTARFEAALERRDWQRATWAVNVGIERGTPAILSRVLDLLEREDPEIVQAFEAVAGALRRAGHLDEAWTLRALRAVESERFPLGTATFQRDFSAAERAALFDAFASTARAGRTAAEAACELLIHDLTTWEDPRLPAVLDAAPPPARATLLQCLAWCRAPESMLDPRLVPLLLSEDSAVAERIYQTLCLRRQRADAIFAEIYDRVRAPELRRTLAIRLGRERDDSLERYWLDENQPLELDEPIDDILGSHGLTREMLAL